MAAAAMVVDIPKEIRLIAVFMGQSFRGMGSHSELEDAACTERRDHSGRYVYGISVRA
jgi:hypothetical protein